jgi:hypothetical protein
MLTFLKKLGQVAVKVGTVIADVAAGAPIVEGLVNKFIPSNVLPVAEKIEGEFALICEAVQYVEVFAAQLAAGGTVMTGAQKLAMAVTMVGNIMGDTIKATGHTIANPALYAQAVQEFAQAACDYQNALSETGVTP